jgi:hypothetical protein
MRRHSSHTRKQPHGSFLRPRLQGGVAATTEACDKTVARREVCARRTGLHSDRTPRESRSEVRLELAQGLRHPNAPKRLIRHRHQHRPEAPRTASDRSAQGSPKGSAPPRQAHSSLRQRRALDESVRTQACFLAGRYHTRTAGVLQQPRVGQCGQGCVASRRRAVSAVRS